MFNALVFDEFTDLTTPRLRMRQFVVGDGRALYERLRNPEAAARAFVPAIGSADLAEMAVIRYRDNFEKRRSIRWAITGKDTGELIGMCSFQQVRPPHRRAEISYEIASDYWRQGYGSEAVRAMLDYGFQTMNLHRIEAVTEPENEASQALLRKIGFTYEGTLRQRFMRAGKLHDDVFFALLAPEWLAE